MAPDSKDCPDFPGSSWSLRPPSMGPLEVSLTPLGVHDRLKPAESLNKPSCVLKGSPTYPADGSYFTCTSILWGPLFMQFPKILLLCKADDRSMT